MGGWNQWTVIAHDPSSELNHFALQGALVKRFSGTNLIALNAHQEVNPHLHRGRVTNQEALTRC